jgi:hypothetical protein
LFLTVLVFLLQLVDFVGLSLDLLDLLPGPELFLFQQRDPVREQLGVVAGLFFLPLQLEEVEGVVPAVALLLLLLLLLILRELIPVVLLVQLNLPRGFLRQRVLALLLLLLLLALAPGTAVLGVGRGTVLLVRVGLGLGAGTLVRLAAGLAVWLASAGLGTVFRLTRVFAVGIAGAQRGLCFFLAFRHVRLKF